MNHNNNNHNSNDRTTMPKPHDPKNQIQAAIYGLLIGDAVGVPYEFNRPAQLPAYADIDLCPPTTFKRSYPNVPLGTWSDDGAQALCLLASLQQCQGFDSQDFAQRLLNWYRVGYMAVDYEVFDVGIQTREALERMQAGQDIADIANRDEQSNGNGALMRCLPLALWHRGTDEELVQWAEAQSHITHAHLRSKVCCAFYCLWARYLLQGQSVNSAWDYAYQRLVELYQQQAQALLELREHLCPAQDFKISGSGYVVDCLHSAKFALQQESYVDVIKTAIALGNDTDTTACVAGGLAGIIFGFDGIPKDWLTQLRGQELLSPLVQQLLQHLDQPVSN